MTLQELYEFALSYYGVPYQWGGDGPLGMDKYGFDCSGFVQCILKKANVDPPGDQTAHDLYLYFKKNGYPAVVRGSLAFFGSEDRVSHVGWMIDNKIMISAAGGGPAIRARKIAIYNNASVKIQPISYYKVPALVGCYSPHYAFL